LSQIPLNTGGPGGRQWARSTGTASPHQDAQHGLELFGRELLMSSTVDNSDHGGPWPRLQIRWL